MTKSLDPRGITAAQDTADARFIRRVRPEGDSEPVSFSDMADIIGSYLDATTAEQPQSDTMIDLRKWAMGLALQHSEMLMGALPEYNVEQAANSLAKYALTSTALGDESKPKWRVGMRVRSRLETDRRGVIASMAGDDAEMCVRWSDGVRQPFDAASAHDFIEPDE
jgi:hypothetical protein